jgi:archaellum component FlaF (FlaF/FlaG flagellin family)
MKNTKIMMLLVVSTFYSFCSAQKITPTPAQELEASKEDIKNTAYILEGTVIKQKRFHALNYEVYVCNVISITKIYRGSPVIKLGTIKVLIETTMIEKNGFRSVMSDGENISIAKNHSYIIFGKPVNFKSADSNSVDSILTDNAMTLIITDIPIALNGNTAQWGQTSYKTLDELYSFFKENGVTVQEEEQQK